MIHAGVFASNATAFVVTISFNPGGSDYTGKTVTVTITTNVGRFRWRIDTGSWTTVAANTGNVSVPLSAAGHDLTAEALDAADNTLATHTENYSKSETGLPGNQ